MNKSINYFYILLVFFSSNELAAQVSKFKVEKRINHWYRLHPDNYEINIDSKEGHARITRYHPERPEEKNDIIVVEYEGMDITIKFEKPIEEITCDKDSLQKYFSYLAIDRIFHNIKKGGWDISPRTALSANRDKNCIEFLGTNNKQLNFEINWETFTFCGTSNSKECQEFLIIEDGSMPENCYLSVERKLPLKVKAESISIEGK